MIQHDYTIEQFFLLDVVFLLLFLLLINRTSVLISNHLKTHTLSSHPLRLLCMRWMNDMFSVVLDMFFVVLGKEFDSVQNA